MFKNKKNFKKNYPQKKFVKNICINIFIWCIIKVREKKMFVEHELHHAIIISKNNF